MLGCEFWLIFLSLASNYLHSISNKSTISHAWCLRCSVLVLGYYLGVGTMEIYLYIIVDSQIVPKFGFVSSLNFVLEISLYAHSNGKAMKKMLSAAIRLVSHIVVLFSSNERTSISLWTDQAIKLFCKGEHIIKLLRVRT